MIPISIKTDWWIAGILILSWDIKTKSWNSTYDFHRSIQF